LARNFLEIRQFAFRGCGEFCNGLIYSGITKKPVEADFASVVQ
jgi:hypothetical protein